MQTKKLFVLMTIDQEDGGFLGNPVALEIPDTIGNFPDAVEYLKGTLYSQEFINLMHDGDYNSWGEEQENCIPFDQFKLESVEYISGCCRWTFLTEDECDELIIDKNMDFVTQVVL